MSLCPHNSDSEWCDECRADNAEKTISALRERLGACERERDQVEAHATYFQGRGLELLNDCAALIAERDAYRARAGEIEAALRVVMDNLGVPQPGYPGPIVVAYEAARAALGDGGGGIADDSARKAAGLE